MMTKFSLNLSCSAVGLLLIICRAEQYTTLDLDIPQITNAKYPFAGSLINAAIDLALEKIKKEIVEPIPLQDNIVYFNKNLLIIPVRGEIALYSGKLSGVKTIRRASNAHFTIRNLHDIEVNCSFSFERLNFTYDFEANLCNKVSTKGKTNGDIIQLIADTNMIIDLINKTIELTSLTLKTASSMDLRLESEKYVDKLINFMIKMIASNFKAPILAQIEKELHSILQQKFHYNTPKYKDNAVEY